MKNSLGDIISELRKKKGLTQKELADELNTSDKSVSRWETGNSYPDLDMIFHISKYFNVSFNSLLQARIEEDDTDDYLVKEIIQEFTEINKRISKRIRIGLSIIFLVILILVIAIIFTNSYNRFKVYKVNIESNDFTSTNGVYVETKIKDTLYLGNFKFKNIELKNTDYVSVDIYILDKGKEKIIYNNSTLEDLIFTNSESYMKIDDLSDYINNLYIKVTIIDEEGNVQTFKSKLNLVLDFSNNKIFYKSSNKELLKYNIKSTIDKNEIIEKLLDNGFKKITKFTYAKRTKNYVINYQIDSNIINYSYEKNKFSYRYIYNLNLCELLVNVFDENNTEIENYIYDNKNNKIVECINGSCNNYKEAMKILNKNILYLLK